MIFFLKKFQLFQREWVACIFQGEKAFLKMFKASLAKFGI